MERRQWRAIVGLILLVVITVLIAAALPIEQRGKLHVIYQSAEPVGERRPYQRYFHVAVIGHLRDEKDPLRPALARALWRGDSGGRRG